MTSSSSADNTASSSSYNPRDPSGYLKHTSNTNNNNNNRNTSSPTVVKVVGTARDDINGLLGMVLSFNVDRQRYLVHMSVAQSTMALKPENIQKANILERYQCHWEQLRNDPRVKEKVQHYIRWCQDKVHPYPLWHVLTGCGVLVVTLCYFFGITKCLMMTSLLLLLCVIVLPDLLERSSWTVVLKNFPKRCQSFLEQQFPMLKGRLTDKIALGIILLVVAFCVQSLFVSTSNSTKTRTSPPMIPKPGGVAPKSINNLPKHQQASLLTPETIQKYYDLGFEDALQEKPRGSSIATELEQLHSRAVADMEQPEEHQPPQRRRNTMDQDAATTTSLDYDHDDVIYTPPSPPSSKSLLSRLFNFSSIGSMIYVYRMIQEKGIDPSTNLFSMGQLAANLQHNTPWWQQGMLAFSIYNLIRIVLL